VRHAPRSETQRVFIPGVTDDSQGVRLATMQELAHYWGTDYATRVGAPARPRIVPALRAATLRRSEQSQARIKLMLFAMSQKPRIELPKMITWSVWASIQVLNLARNVLLWSGLKTA
jgi:hypothetical protein